MKQTIQDLIAQALADLQQSDVLPTHLQTDIQVTPSKDRSQGDFASNIAMMLAKASGKPPRELADLIVMQIGRQAAIDRIDVAGPGFINFFLASDAGHSIINNILQRGEAYGTSDYGKGEKIQVEFVSANPTGPLHVGHGRGAATGDAIASLLEWVAAAGDTSSARRAASESGT